MKLKIDTIDYIIDTRFINLTIFQYCFKMNINLPCFCYHEKLTIAGNCRMCVVLVNNNLVVSCAVNITDDMVIFTNNKRVREARESILEFLLINHPLDCPICDQGGECDLQDISLMYGSDRGRFYEDKKRAVDNFSQNGPLIKTVMTRCIHCTRCVRFANEISNFSLGVLDRGYNMEIGTYYNIDLLDELSGNIIDLCPVGAPTSMPYAFKQRSWESLFYTNIDFLDSVASSVRLYVYSNRITRIIPVLDESLNEEWITNKIRFSYDALIINRINYPKLNVFCKLIVISWDFAINIFFYYIKKTIFNNKKIYSSLGFYSDLKTTLSIKLFFNNFGCSNILYNLQKINWIYDFIDFIYLGLLLEEIEFVNFYLFISCDLRLESPLLNVRIKKNYNLNKNNELFLYSYGLSLNYLTYPIKNLGNNIFKFILFLEGKQRFSCDFFFKSFYYFSSLGKFFNFYIKMMCVLGNCIIYRVDSKSFLLSFIYFIKKQVIDLSLNLINSFLGFYSYSNLIIDKTKVFKINDINFLYALSIDFDYNNDNNNKTFIVFQNFIKNKLYFKANLILPVLAPFEYDSLFINLEGKYRKMRQAIKSFFTIYTDWDIIFLFSILNKKKKILKINYLVNYYIILNYFINTINYFCSFFLSTNSFYIELFYYIAYVSINIIKNKLKHFIYNIIISINSIKFQNTFFNTFINNYYLSDFFVKNSKVMSFSALKKYKNFKLAC